MMINLYWKTRVYAVSALALPFILYYSLPSDIGDFYWALMLLFYFPLLILLLSGYLFQYNLIRSFLNVLRYVGIAYLIFLFRIPLPTKGTVFYDDGLGFEIILSWALTMILVAISGFVLVKASKRVNPHEVFLVLSFAITMVIVCELYVLEPVLRQCN